MSERTDFDEQVDSAYELLVKDDMVAFTVLTASPKPGGNSWNLGLAQGNDLKTIRECDATTVHRRMGALAIALLADTLDMEIRECGQMLTEHAIEKFDGRLPTPPDA